MNNINETPPISDDNFWEQNHSSHPQHEKGTRSKDAQFAYQAGHDGYDRYSGKSFDEAETELKKDYEQLALKSGINIQWQKARDIARIAWDQAGTT